MSRETPRAKTLDVAQRLVALGLSVIPLRTRDKRPDGDVLPGGSWAPFQERSATADELRAWFGDERGASRNIGIVCGQVSGVVVVDSDSPEAEAFAASHLPETPVKVQTAQGWHRYFRHPGDGEIRNSVKIKTNGSRIALDVRADGGYVVGPTSRHPSGYVYCSPTKWPSTLDVLPVFDRTLLAAEDRAPRLEVPIVVPVPVLADRAQLLRRARAYVARVEPAVQGNAGDSRTFQLCCRLLRGFVLTVDEAFAVLAEWNARCQPPWSDRELLEKLRGADKYGSEPIGSLAATPAPHANPALAVKYDPLSATESAQIASPRQSRIATILDEAPPEIARPLCIVGTHAYAATWAHLDTQPDPVLVVVRNDGRVFCDVALEGAVSLQSLELQVHLPQPIAPNARWSGRGVKAFQAGYRADPRQTFETVTGLVTHHVEFVRSLADQDVMAELHACYILASYCLDAFDCAGYLYFNGEAGSGKTTALNLTTSLSYLGTPMLASSSVPSLRDLSDYGGLMGLDDAEQVSDPKFDPDKKALLLSGNQRGSIIAVKEPMPGHKRGWLTRYVKLFSPRVFSAIKKPDPVLASRCLIIPMCKASHNVPDVTDLEQWPVPRDRVIDDLWNVALTSLPQIRAINRDIVNHTQLVGRTLQPWRSILTIARWLDVDHGAVGLFGRMVQLSLRYQEERAEIEAGDPVRLIIQSLGYMLEGGASRLGVEFKTSDLAARVNHLAKDLDLSDDGQEFITARRLGWKLKGLRFKRPSKTSRHWIITETFWNELASAHGVIAPSNTLTDAEQRTDGPGVEAFEL